MIISTLSDNWARAAWSGCAEDCVCLVTIIEVKGSTPREVGAMMLVHPELSEGSIGGGELEFQALKTARSHHPETGFERQLRSYPLGPSLGQCCGGSVKVMFEWYQPESRELLARFSTQIDGYSLHETSDQSLPEICINPPTKMSKTCFALPLAGTASNVFVYGAGHVGRAVIELAHHLNCKLHWVDVNEDRYPQTIPPEVIKLPARVPQNIAKRAPKDAIHLVMTYSHQLDYDIIHALLASGKFAKCGLIGSATKAARFKSRLRKNGLSAARIKRLVCPIGLAEVAGKTPIQVALSITAQLSNWLDEQLELQNQN